MRKRRRINILIVVIALILVVAAVYSGLRILESAVFESTPETVTTKTIVRNGVHYFPRQDITVFLVMGIDEYGPVKDSMSYNNRGEADVVLLAIFDETAKECKVLALNRDTMVDMPILGLGGKVAGMHKAQLALSHTYGSGLEDSCENVRDTLMDFIHGLTVDYYVALNMDAILVMNDAVGGVTVNVTEDFSEVNPTIQMGEMTLRGQQALDYVRTRKDVGDQKNITRMERHKGYIDGFIRALRAKTEENPEFLLTSYEQIAPYLVTDCSLETMATLLNRYAGYEIVETVTPEGENLIIDGHYQFFPDEEKLDALILELFYRPKK